MRFANTESTLINSTGFKEEDHPRGEGGEFTKGGGESGSTTGKKKKKITEKFEELGIKHKEDENGNIVISAEDALEYAGDIWGEEETREEDPDTDQDTPG